MCVTGASVRSWETTTTTTREKIIVGLDSIEPFAKIINSTIGEQRELILGLPWYTGIV